MRYRVSCACGWESIGEEDEVVAATQEHGRRLHNMEVDHATAMEMAEPVED